MQIANALKSADEAQNAAHHGKNAGDSDADEYRAVSLHPYIPAE